LIRTSKVLFRGFVTGPAAHRKAPFEIGVDQHANAEVRQWGLLLRCTGRREGTHLAIAALVSDRAVERPTRHKPSIELAHVRIKSCLKAELLVALSTCSSEAVLPQPVRELEILGVGRPVVGIVIGKWENDFDTEQARSVLRSSSTPAQSADTDAAKVGADT
jgi:hypothetical protein